MSLRVYIASPYRGDTGLHVAYARAATRHSLERDEAPIVPHLVYPDALYLVGDFESRDALARKAALSLIAGAQLLAVYEDLGRSAGMKAEVAEALRVGTPVEVRRLGYPWTITDEDLAALVAEGTWDQNGEVWKLGRPFRGAEYRALDRYFAGLTSDPDPSLRLRRK